MRRRSWRALCFRMNTTRMRHLARFFYDFSTGIGVPTNGISADYAYDGPGIDWTDDRTFLAIAPTLFDSEDGFIQGWSAWDIVNGKFSGRVYATAPLVRVWFTVEADQIVYGRSGR